MRTPDKIILHPRDEATGFRRDTVKTLWKTHRQAGESLKHWARRAVKDIEGFEPVKRWLSNKAANPSNPPQAIGRTNGKRKGKK
jgi:hypothetical protein